MLQLTESVGIREDLEALMDAGASLSELDAELELHHLSDEEHAEFWMYCWALLQAKASGAVVAVNAGYGYQAVEEG
jgi:hypothetical protein